MQLIRTDTSEAIDLPDDYWWSDELRWNPAVLRTEYTLTGALIAEGSVRQSGRLITLVPLNDHIWVPRSIVESLREWAALSALEMTWTFRGDTRDVLFRASEIAVDAEPVLHIEEAEGTDPQLLTLRLIET